MVSLTPASSIAHGMAVKRESLPFNALCPWPADLPARAWAISPRVTDRGREEGSYVARRKFLYVRLHDHFPDHPKVAGLSDAAFRAQVTAICYAHRFGTDGFVPQAMVRVHPRRAVDELVRFGLWEVADGGYVVHDYLEWNEARSEIEAKRESKRIAGAMGAATRWDSKDDGSTHDPGVIAIATASSRGSRAKPPNKVSAADFDAFWAVYPRKDDKAPARRAFAKALTKASLEAILAGAERYRDDPNREAEFTKYPATWLNAEAWENGPLPDRLSQMSEAERWLADARKEAENAAR